MPVVKSTPEMLAAELAAMDWARVEAQTDTEIAAAVASDPDAARIRTGAEMVAGRIRMIRRKLGLTQAAFAARYGLPMETLEAWEAGTVAPDAAARAYLRAIGNQPDAVAAAYAAE